MKNLFKTINVSVIAIALASSNLMATDIFAATQGSLAATSTGSVDIAVTKPARAKISNLSDLTLASWVNGDGDVTLTNDVCVYSSKANGGYTIKASGSGASSAYTLANGSNLIPYNVTWNSGGVGALANTGTALAANTTSSPLTHAARDSSTCTGATPGPTARLVVGMLATDLDSAVDGSYDGTLTLLVTPN
jgi:hypothetical protein